MMSTVTRKLKMVVSTLFSEIQKKISPTSAGPDKYFRHEIKNADGSHSVILIGGTPGGCGWAELFFDKNGKYVFNNMNVEDYSDPWLNDALHAEGVDTGNPYLDDDLSDSSGSAADGNATYIEQ